VESESPEFLKKVLERGFSASDLEQVAFDLWYGTSVYDDVTTYGIPKTKKAQMLIDYAVQNMATKRLTDHLQRMNPRMYATVLQS
jgi:hypothetical protein